MKPPTEAALTPVMFVPTPLEGVPRAPPFTTNAPAVPVFTASAVPTPVPRPVMPVSGALVAPIVPVPVALSVDPLPTPIAAVVFVPEVSALNADEPLVHVTKAGAAARFVQSRQYCPVALGISDPMMPLLLNISA